MNFYFIASEDFKVFGIGQTTRSFKERHKDPDWAKLHNYLKARGEKVIIIGWWEGVEGITDYGDLHPWVVQQPTVKKHAEWFSHDNQDLYILKHKLEKQFFSGIKKEKKNIKLFHFQEEFLNKILSGWDQWKEFLLFAKCRAGKSVMTLSAIVRKGVKVSLVVSRHTSPIQSWKEDSQEYSDFDNLVFIDLADKNFVDQINYWYNTEKQLVLWTTIQGENRWKNIPCKVDFLVYDEAHIGYNSKQWKELRKEITCPVLYVTGTAFDMVWDFNDYNRYIYSYFEEQRDKKLGLRHAPTMQVIVVKYDSDEYKKIYGDDPDAMKNLFSLNDDKNDFSEPSLVRGFYSDNFGPQRHLRVDKRLLKDAKHIYMCLPSVDACHLSVPYLETFSNFKPLVVTGDTKKDADSIRKHIVDNPEGTIILTVKANVLGVTIKEIDTVINCSEGDSLNFWTQFAFRGGSSDRNWDVIDFCPQRCLESFRKAFLAACDNDPTLCEYKYADFAAFYEWCNGLEDLNEDHIFEILSVDVGNSIRLISGIASSLDIDKLKNFNMNLELNSNLSDRIKSVVVNDNDANGKSNKILVDSDKPEREVDFDLQNKIQSVKAILERIPLVIFHSIRNGFNPNNIQSVTNSEHYVYDTLDKENILEDLVNSEIINAKSLSYRISQAAIDIKNSMLKDECMTLEELSCTRQDQKTIPVQLVNQLLS